MSQSKEALWPIIRTAGIDGFLISFSHSLSEPANRAALAFREAIENAGWDGIEETSTSLVSTYLRFDPLWHEHSQIQHMLEKLIKKENWLEMELPRGRKLWRVPTVFGTSLAPLFSEAAHAAGLTPDAAIASISQTRVRVQTIGFAPGMPYLGELPQPWDLPRQTELSARIPIGGLCVAIRQLVLFPVETSTGWRHIGQTAIQVFQQNSDDPFLLRPGDEVYFEPTTPERLSSLKKDPYGGAVAEAIS